jgi:hypothetical protein
MKKRLSILLLIIGYQVFGQMPGVPDSINYQAVLRDAAGNVLAPGTNGILNFQVFSDFSSGSPAYEENHNFTTSSVGLVHLYIGGGNKVGTNTMANVNWAGGSACYEVRLNGSLIGTRQAFASVPYALYARSAGGGSLPSGLLNQTLFHDGISWKPTNNLSNDGINIGIGIQPLSGTRLRLVSGASDSTGFSVTKSGATGRDAGFRAFTYGASAANLVNPNSTVIYGADLVSTNIGSGYAVGASGIGVSAGVAVGVSGVATGNGTSTLIGVYGSVEAPGTGPNRYAAFFNKGKVVVNDAILFPTVTNTTTMFYTLNAFNEGTWVPFSASSPISLSGTGIIGVTPASPSTNFTINAVPPSFQSINIGTITLGSYPNYNLNIPSPTFSFNPSTGFLSYAQTPFSTALNISPALALVGSTLSVGSNTLNIPALNFWARPTNTATELGNPADNVGIGITNPTEKLVIHAPANVDVSIITGFTNSAILNFGSTATHTLGRIAYNNSNNSMSFWVNNGPDKIFINNTGNVGINTNAPGAKLDINGDFRLGTGGNVLLKVIGGTATPLVGSINPNANLPFSFTATGAATGDKVVVTMAGGTSTTVFLGSATVTGTNQITVNLFNLGATAAPGGTYTFNYIIYK